MSAVNAMLRHRYGMDAATSCEDHVAQIDAQIEDLRERGVATPAQKKRLMDLMAERDQWLARCASGWNPFAAVAGQMKLPSFGEEFGAADEDDDVDFELAMDDEEEAFGQDEDEDDEFGLLGIALSDKAKAKKWAEKYVETNRRLAALKRADARGADSVNRHHKGIFQKRKVDIDKQISKLEEDQEKALREYRATKASKRDGKTLPPAVYLHSIGEDVDVKAASRTRKKLATYGGRLGARGAVTSQAASGGDPDYEAAVMTARNFPGSSLGFVFHGAGASKGSTGAFVSVPVRSSQDFAATKDDVLRNAAMSAGFVGANPAAMEWMNSAGPGGGYVTVVFRNYPARGVDGNAGEDAARRTIRAFPGSAMAFVFFGAGAQRRSTGACASIPVPSSQQFDNTRDLALLQATMSAADARSNPGSIEWMNTPGPGGGYITVVFRS